MPIVNVEKLLAEANKYIKNPDVIVDVFDMTYTWVSDYHCEVTGYTKEEQENMRIEVNSQVVGGDTGKTAPEAAVPFKPFERKVVITTKTGEKKVYDTQGIVIEFNNQPFLVGKMIAIVNTNNTNN